jgi:hypothetical protein
MQRLRPCHENKSGSSKCFDSIPIDSKDPSAMSIAKALGKSEKTIRTRRRFWLVAHRPVVGGRPMSDPNSDAALDDVLDAFAVEPTPGRDTLERYLRHYPQFANELIDLSRELHREVPAETGPESAEDQARIEAAWRRHRDAGVPQTSSLLRHSPRMSFARSQRPSTCQGRSSPPFVMER